MENWVFSFRSFSLSPMERKGTKPSVGFSPPPPMNSMGSGKGMVEEGGFGARSSRECTASSFPVLSAEGTPAT